MYRRSIITFNLILSPIICVSWAHSMSGFSSPKVAPSFPSDATDSAEVLRYHRSKRDYLIESGQKSPLIYPLHFLPTYLLILYFLLPLPSPRPKSFITRTYRAFYENSRFPFFAIICYGSYYTINNTTSAMVTVEYGIGIIWVWTVIWSASMMLFGDKRKVAQRFERRGGVYQLDAIDEKEKSDGVAKASASTIKDQRRSSRDEGKGGTAVWVLQGLPKDFRHRFDWTFDLLSSFRGPGWNFQVSSIPGPPSEVTHGLSTPAPKLPPPPSRPPPSRHDLLLNIALRFIGTLAALDTCKYLAMQDAYFWSLPRSDTPSPYPYPYLSRLILSVTYVYFSLNAIFLLLPLLTQSLGPRYLGYHAETWLYPDFFGTGKEVWDKGLAGAWGGWWHQLFRYGFEAWGDAIAAAIEKLPGGGAGSWKKRTPRGKLLRTIVAFGLSAAIHTSASYTTLGPTNPWGGSFRFFMVQPVGIVAQMLLRKYSKPLQSRLPQISAATIGGITNLLFVFFWFLWCGPWVSDDFAAGGIWLYEPIPFSLIRGLTGEGWWRWGGTWVKWHRGERWWESGIAIG